MRLEIYTFVVTPFVQNARVLIDPVTKQGMLVDPGGDTDALISFIERSGAKVTTIFLTHSHIDHVGGARRVLEALNTLYGKRPILIGHKAEKDLRSSVEAQAAFFGLSPEEYQSVNEPDRYVEDGETVDVGGIMFQCLFTPGHSPGHVALFAKNISCIEHFVDVATGRVSGEKTYIGPLAISGDLIFVSCIGRTDLPGGNHRQLLKSIREKILTLPNETVLLPGHGPETTVGAERTSNPFLQ